MVECIGIDCNSCMHSSCPNKKYGPTAHLVSMAPLAAVKPEKRRDVMAMSMKDELDKAVHGGLGLLVSKIKEISRVDDPEYHVRKILELIGEDPDREGLQDTPKRVVRSWEKLYGGYKEDPKKILGTVFVDGSCNEMVVLKDIEFTSSCEHHMLPFSGHVSIGYIPDGKVVGVSKLARLVEVFARRLQIQERMTTQIADTLMEVLQPKGVMVITSAQHLCMTSRGVEKKDAKMVTSAIRGAFGQPEVRAEFMAHLGWS